MNQPPHRTAAIVPLSEYHTANVALLHAHHQVVRVDQARDAASMATKSHIRMQNMTKKTQSMALKATIAHTETQNRQARSEEHTSELQSLMRISYAVLCLKKKKNITPNQ